MRNGVVTVDHDVEGAIHRIEVAEIGAPEVDLPAEASCLATCAAESTVADVGANNAVAVLGEPDRLGSDAACAVQDVPRPGTESVSDQPIEDATLPLHRFFPIPVDQVVVVGQAVVEL